MMHVYVCGGLLNKTWESKHWESPLGWQVRALSMPTGVPFTRSFTGHCWDLHLHSDLCWVSDSISSEHVSLDEPLTTNSTSWKLNSLSFLKACPSPRGPHLREGHQHKLSLDQSRQKPETRNLGRLLDSSYPLACPIRHMSWRCCCLLTFAWVCSLPLLLTVSTQTSPWPNLFPCLHSDPFQSIRTQNPQWFFWSNHIALLCKSSQ